MELSKKTIILGISALAVIGAGVGYYFINKDSGETLGWMSSSWLYRKSVAVANSGSTLTNEDVLLVVDSATLISAGKLQNDCDDFRFTDSDETTSLSYWIEGGCNTATTQVWIRIPSLTAGGKTIYMYYGNSSATNAEASWSGNFITLADSSCTNGWTRDSTYDSKFIYGATSYASTGGTASSHNHSGSFSITSSAGSDAGGVGGGEEQVCSNNVTHTHTISGSISTESSAPQYIEAYVCKKDDLSILNNLIMFSDSTTPSGWTRASAFDNRFPLGSTSYGTTGGNTTHTHTISSLAVGTGAQDCGEFDPPNPNSRRCSSPGHIHTASVASNTSGSNNPPYKNLLFVKAPTLTTLNQKVILMSSAVPPLGWTQYSSMNNYFLMGSGTVNTTAQGSSTHSHSIAFTTDGPTGSFSRNASNYPMASSTHTHTGNLSLSATVIPPYATTIYIQRKTSQSITLGNEETANTMPNAPSSLLAEGLVNPSSVIDYTPEFSAIFSDSDTSDKGKYYQIQVNTASDFSGTTMWDSTKVAISPELANGSRSADITYAGSTLIQNTLYYWRMKFWDNQATASESNWSSTAQFAMNGLPNKPNTLKAENSTDPLKVNDLTPEFTAIFSDPNTSDTGNYYQIQVNTASDFTGTTMWDSTKTAFSPAIVNGAISSEISYAGTALSFNGQKYYWRIKMWDNYGGESEWSSTANFVMDRGPSAPTSLLTNGVTDPTHISSLTPYFSAIYSDPNEDNGNAYEIEINTNNSFTGTVMWDTGKVTSTLTNNTRSPNYTYAGTALTNSNITYYWRIRFWDSDNNIGAWSSTGQFSSLQTSFLFEGVKINGLKLN